MPTEGMLTEPDIIVNGRRLSFAECMTIRVAVSCFQLQLTDSKYRAALGKALSDGYDHQLQQIQLAMFSPRKE